MNVLILTPDAVGSTLLQRLITIYCQFQNFSSPYINIHEITNGISKFYSHDFNREILRRDPKLKYSQSLTDIVNLIDSVDHNIIARLAQYHMLARQDPVSESSNLYNYCNENFFIIATRRKNVFEYALSQSINRITKRLNVYSPNDKIDTFAKFYHSPISLDQTALTHVLNQYKKYVDWSETFFNIGSYFDYSSEVFNIEQYILNLPVFTDSQKSWKDTFGIDFKNWNLCHLLTSDLDNLPNFNKLNNTQSLISTNILNSFYEDFIVSDYNNISDPSWPKVNTIADYENLPKDISNECQNIHQLDSISKLYQNQNLISQLPSSELEFLKEHERPYIDGLQTVKQMVNLGILPGSVPIKKQTLLGKNKLIKNFSECLDTYNKWAIDNANICSPIDPSNIESLISSEQQNWRLPLVSKPTQHITNNIV